MTRLIIAFALCAQVLAANIATAAPCCAFMQMGELTHMAGAHVSSAQTASPRAGHQDKCHCDLTGHCFTSAAGAINTMAAAGPDFPLTASVPVITTGGVAPAHKKRLLRPPSSI